MISMICFSSFANRSLFLSTDFCKILPVLTLTGFRGSGPLQLKKAIISKRNIRFFMRLDHLYIVVIRT